MIPFVNTDLRFTNKKMFKAINDELINAKYQNISFIIMRSNGYMDIVALEKALNHKSKITNHNLYYWAAQGETIDLLQKYANKYNIGYDQVMIYKKDDTGHFLFAPPALVHNYVVNMIPKYLEVIIHVMKQYNGYGHVNLDN